MQTFAQRTTRQPPLSENEAWLRQALGNYFDHEVHALWKWDSTAIKRGFKGMQESSQSIFDRLFYVGRIDANCAKSASSLRKKAEALCREDEGFEYKATIGIQGRTWRQINELHLSNLRWEYEHMPG